MHEGQMEGERRRPRAAVGTDGAAAGDVARGGAAVTPDDLASAEAARAAEAEVAAGAVTEAVAPEPDAEPPRVSGFTAVRRIGAGAQAEIWLVRDDSGDEAVLKVAGIGQDAAAVEREAAAYGHLSHPHLLGVLGTVATDRGTGVLTERLPAGSLASMVRTAGPLTPGQAVTVLVPVAQALAHLHEHGVVHGDVSPANVLFAVDGRPALVDLGVAAVVGGQGSGGATPGFGAPEQWAALDEESGRVRGHEVGAPADMHGWGALGWFALTGRAPGAPAHRAPLPVLVPDVPVELALLLDAALDPDPSCRPGAAEAAAAAYAAAEPEPVPLHASAPPEVAHLLPTLVPEQGKPGRGMSRRGMSGRRKPGRRRPPAPGATSGRVGRRARTGLTVGALAVTALTLLGVLALGGARGTGTAASPTAVPAPASGTDGNPTPGRPTDSSGEAPPGASVDSPSGLATDPAAAADEDVAAILRRIGQARAAALTAPHEQPPDSYAMPGSAAWERDTHVQRELREGGLAFAGLEIWIEPAGDARAAEADTLQVPARMTLSDHTVLDRSGAVVSEVPATRDDVTLVLSAGEDGAWRVAEVTRR